MPPSGGSQTAQLYQESLGNMVGNESGPLKYLTGSWRCIKGLNQALNRSLGWGPNLEYIKGQR